MNDVNHMCSSLVVLIEYGQQARIDQVRSIDVGVDKPHMWKGRVGHMWQCELRSTYGHGSYGCAWTMEGAYEAWKRNIELAQ